MAILTRLLGRYKFRRTIMLICESCGFGGDLRRFIAAWGFQKVSAPPCQHCVKSDQGSLEWQFAIVPPFIQRFRAVRLEDFPERVEASVCSCSFCATVRDGATETFRTVGGFSVSVACT